MTAIIPAFDTTYRDYTTEGVPSSGDHEPEKSDIRQLGRVIDGVVAQVQAALATGTVAALIGNRVYATAAALNADLAPADGSFALVYADATRANNDLWRKNGAAGAGNWTNTGIFLGNVEAAVASMQAAANDARGARTLLEKIYGLPLALPQNSNPNSLAFAATSRAAPADGETYEVVILSTNTGATAINAGGVQMNILNPGTASVMAAGQLVAGTIIALQRNNQFGASFLVGSRALVFPGVATAATAANTQAALEALIGFPAANPSGSVNSLVVSGAAPADGAVFTAYIVATNTGAATLNRGGTVRRITDNPGTGADIGAGVLQAGTLRTFQYSAGGGVYVTTNPRVPTFNATPPVPFPVGAQDSDLANKPWGNVTNNGAGSVIEAIAANLVVIGSSNANANYVGDGFRPDQMITAALNDLYVGDGINFVADLQAQPGAPTSTGAGQLQASAVFMAGKAKWVFPYYWMNDCRTIFYHDNGGVQSQFNALIALIDYIRSKGAEPVLQTGFHPDPRANPGAAGVKALDPFFFSDAAAYPTGGSGRSMVYPVAKATPVSPTTDMVPAATVADFMVSRDWSGGGVARTGYKRIWHWNRTVREIAAAKGCALIDNEVSTMRLCNETVPDLSAGLNAFYNINDPLHALNLMYSQGIKPAILQWARHAAEGRSDRRVFTGV